MNKTPLSEFVERFGQRGAAAKLRLTQAGVRKALQHKREIYVTENKDGTFSAEEIKPFPSTEIKGLRAGNQ